MTSAELKAEYEHRVIEFLGISIGDADPTPADRARAEVYASKVVSELKRNDRTDDPHCDLETLRVEAK